MCATTLQVTGCIDNINVAKKTSFDVGFTVSLMTDAFGLKCGNRPGFDLGLAGKIEPFSPLCQGSHLSAPGDNTPWRKVNLKSEINNKRMISKTTMIIKGKRNKIYFELYEVWNKK
ncbi:hypothetical protein H5410_004729 [Solanum commersonii]|uniref:Uncharacterized protein n=1 Tax=Solanum commersonii TaxID=4109 RepID=A0A9J6A616_SOLCO|nr:hypothetical protein H5410_004729 [Solanum commersonii]